MRRLSRSRFAVLSGAAIALLFVFFVTAHPALAQEGGYYNVSVENETDLVIFGTINSALADDVKKILAANPQITRVVLGSEGGYVKPSEDIAQQIQERGLDTYSNTACFSGCTLIFAAGERRITQPNILFGFHGVGGTTSAKKMFWQTRFVEFFEARGIDTNFAEKMWRYPNDKMRFPNYELLVDSGYITHVQNDGELRTAGEFCADINCQKLPYTSLSELIAVGALNRASDTELKDGSRLIKVEPSVGHVNASLRVPATIDLSSKGFAHEKIRAVCTEPAFAPFLGEYNGESTIFGGVYAHYNNGSVNRTVHVRPEDCFQFENNSK